MAKDKAQPRKRARRTELPQPTQAPAQAEQEDDQQSETRGPPPNAYTFRLDTYTADCFVDANVLLERGISIAKGHFYDAKNLDIRVDVPTARFFDLHTLDPHAPFLWESFCLDGYFVLPPWGPDIQRAWELLSTLDKQGYFTVTDFVGDSVRILLHRDLVRKALNLPQNELAFNEKAFTGDERDNCSDKAEPRWDELKHQAIRLALQLYMQHFHFSYPHR